MKLNSTHYKQSVAKSVKDMGDNTIECVVATDDIDRTGEVLDINGLDIKDYQNNPVVLFSHQSSQLPIGISTSLKKVKDKETGRMTLVSVTKFASDIYPFAETVYKMVRDGFMNACSIGFMPTDYKQGEDGEWIWTKSVMLEYSHVPIPANPNALATMKSLGYSDEEQSFYRDSVMKSLEKKKEIDESIDTEVDEPQNDEEIEQPELKAEVDVLKNSVEILSSSLAAIQSTLAEKDTAPTNERHTAKQVRTKKTLYKLKKIAKVSSDSVSILQAEINKRIKETV